MISVASSYDHIIKSRQINSITHIVIEYPDGLYCYDVGDALHLGRDGTRKGHSGNDLIFKPMALTGFEPCRYNH